MNILFSERLQQLRIDNGLTQGELAKKLNTTQRRISYLETGKIEPDLAALYNIAKFFDVTADYLIGLKDY